MRFLCSCLAGLALAAGVSFAPSTARACGGFFCDNSQPVNQAAERIIFSQDADGEVTALIQIQYAGPAERFAWMLPVQGVPDIAVSSNAAFQRLQSATNPSYRLNTIVEGRCADDFSDSRGGFPSGSSVDAGASFSDSGTMEPPVSVLDEGSVGPYDYIVISVNPDAEDPASEGVEWLVENGYDVSDFGGDLLRPYLESGMNLLAFRLTKGNSAGAIRPVRLSFGVGVPSIPIRPTAVAATDDMGVMVWVLGQSRAIPANYRALELNDALINWFNPNTNYNDVVTRAADEAGGQGFVTEHAGDATPLANSIWQSFEASQWESLRDSDWTDRHGELVLSVGQFAGFDGANDVYRRHLTVPEGVDEDAFFGCLGCYVGFEDATLEGFDPAAFLAQFQTDVIDPMAETAELFEDTYVTRLYTTMSAHEMTMDPIFDFNADLGDHDRQHVADRIIECDPGVNQFEAPWRTTLPNGETVRGTGRTWPFALGDMPATRRTRRIGTEGEGAVIDDNVGAIHSALADHNATVPRRNPHVTGGGCSAAGGASGAVAFVMLGLGLVARRRKA